MIYLYNKLINLWAAIVNLKLKIKINKCISHKRVVISFVVYILFNIILSKNVFITIEKMASTTILLVIDWKLGFEII